MNSLTSPPPAAPSRRPLRRWALGLAAASAALLVAACGGGGSAGSGGTGAAPHGVSRGTITGFGSVIVDGVHYDDRKLKASIDSPPGAPDAGGSATLKFGQRVELTFSASGADQALISAEIVGSVDAIAPDLVVLGQVVKINTYPTLGPVTVFEGFASAADIQVGDRVEVHGVPTAAGVVQATRIERRPAADAWLRLGGTVANLAADGKSFQIGSINVLLDAGTTVLPVGSALANGQEVVVWSTTGVAGGNVTASIVRIKRPDGDATAETRVGGPVTDCTAPCAASFKVAGVSIDASAANFMGGTAADLTNGKWVFVRGSLDATTGVLKADRVILRGHRDEDGDAPRLKGAITDFVDMTHFKVRGVPVTTDANTVIGASCPNPLADGTLVSLTGSVDGFAVLAKTIDCFTSVDGFHIEARGAIAKLNTELKTFTLVNPAFAGVTFSYSADTQFNDGASATDLAVGKFVKVEGQASGSTVEVREIRVEPTPPAVPVDVKLFVAEGIASAVTSTDGSTTGLQVNGLTMVVNADTLIFTADGPLVDGAKVRVVFKRQGDVNIALLVKTDH
jgi:hypothetical protein